MPYDPLILNVGVGGSTLATDTFTDTDSTTKTMPYGAVAFGPLNGPYVVVTSTVGLPVAVVGSVAVTGTFWQATQPISAASLPLPTGASADASVTGLQVAQASTTSGQKGTLIQGAVTTAAPVYTTAQTSPLSLTTAGALRVDGSGVTQPVSMASTTITGTVAVTQSTSPWVVSLTSTTITGSVAVTGTFWQATQPISGTVTVNTISGFATEATLAARIPVNGQALMAASVPVTLASNQSALAVTGTFWQATQPVSLTSTTITGSVAVTQSGTWSLAANQSVNTAQINGITPLMGNGATGTGSQRVTLSSDQVSTAAILTDALANPTLGQQAVLSSLFNGTTWDRQRGMSTNNTTGDTGAKTATGNGVAIANVGNKGVSIVLSLGTVLGTTPTFVLKVQGSADNGTTWYDIPGATTATITATGVFGITIYPGAPTVAGTATSISGTASCGQPLPRMWRVVWTIGGTTPSYTITNIQYNYLPN